MAEDGETPVTTTPEEETKAEPEKTGPMDTRTALREVLKKALMHDGLKRGLHEAAKALDRGSARLCCLAEDCDEPNYTRLVRALCSNGGIPLVMVPKGEELGEWAGLCKIDKEGNATKVVKCSCVAVTDYGQESEALSILLDLIKQSGGDDVNL
uniref:40S ribosomal protein S12 n=1 Tax=Bicosoecida sp. CB-2014 TaxID=1486930 RepID=A0A7S1CEP1_9STRA